MASRWLEFCSRGERRIQIHGHPGWAADPQALLLSSGTRTARDADVVEGSYEQDARVPCEPWRTPCDAELAALLAPEPPRDIGRSVYITAASSRFTLGENERLRLLDPDAVEAMIGTALREKFTLGEPVDFLGYTGHRAGLTTTTVDHAVGRSIGLHVDSWDNLSLERRDLSCNRISINVGRNQRYFLFLPISVMEMGRVLAAELGESKVPRADLTAMGRLFMRAFPEVPVVRCRLNPGEAYIAPTENLVHDGSSVGHDGLDEQFVILGHIRPKAAGRAVERVGT